MIAIAAASALSGIIIGYAIGNARRKSPGTNTLVSRLCGVIEEQSRDIRASQRQSLDAAVMRPSDQLERAANERLADINGSTNAQRPAKNEYDYLGKDDDLDDLDGFHTETVPTEMP